MDREPAIYGWRGFPVEAEEREGPGTAWAGSYEYELSEGDHVVAIHLLIGGNVGWVMDYDTFMSEAEPLSPAAIEESEAFADA